MILLLIVLTISVGVNRALLLSEYGARTRFFALRTQRFHAPTVLLRIISHFYPPRKGSLIQNDRTHLLLCRRLVLHYRCLARRASVHYHVDCLIPAHCFDGCAAVQVPKTAQLLAY